MRRWLLPILLLLAALPAAARGGDRAGDFDYYVLALSWSPAWCEDEGIGSGAAQCEPFREIGFVLHGLWPQYLDGWPQDCASEARDPTEAEAAAMAGIMGSADQARYQWRKHGRCSGLDPERYFALARAAWEAVRQPEALQRLRFPERVRPRSIETAFLNANPRLETDGVTVTCKGRRFREVRICLDRDLSPRACTGRAARDCDAEEVLILPVR